MPVLFVFIEVGCRFGFALPQLQYRANKSYRLALAFALLFIKIHDLSKM